MPARNRSAATSTSAARRRRHGRARPGRRGARDEQPSASTAARSHFSSAPAEDLPTASPRAQPRVGEAPRDSQAVAERSERGARRATGEDGQDARGGAPARARSGAGAAASAVRRSGRRAPSRPAARRRRTAMTATRPLFAAAKPGSLTTMPYTGDIPVATMSIRTAVTASTIRSRTRAQDERDEREHERGAPRRSRRARGAPRRSARWGRGPRSRAARCRAAARRTGGARSAACLRASRSSERARSSTNGTSMTAASATPAAARGAERQQPQRQAAAQVLGRQRAEEHEHRRDDEHLEARGRVAAEELQADTSASPAAGSGAGRRRQRSASSHIHGNQAHTDIVRPRDPGDRPEAEAEDEPGEQRAALAHPELAAEQVRAEGGDEELEHRDDAERVHRSRT